MPDAAISFRNVTKRYNGLTALDNVSFEVEKGSFFGYLGPNGAGKTTTINILTGLSNFDTGTAKVFGYDVVKDYIQARALVGLAKQEITSDPWLKVEELLTYQGSYYNMERTDVHERVEALLKVFDLDGKAEAHPMKLSGGMKRRLELAKSLVHDPPLLILDEPTEGTDVSLRRRLWNYFRRVNEEGKTILLTTHYMEEAEKLCDTIAIIDKGKIVRLEDRDTLLGKLKEQKVLLTLQEPLKSVPTGLPGGKAILEAKGKRLVVRMEHVQEELPKLLASLAGKGVRVKGMDVVRDHLEDIYLSITGDGVDGFSGI